MCGRSVQKEEAHQNEYAAHREEQRKLSGLENEHRYVHHRDDEKDAASCQAHTKAGQSLAVAL